METTEQREQYSAELGKILRELLPAGAARDWEKLLELATDIERLAIKIRIELRESPT